MIVGDKDRNNGENYVYNRLIKCPWVGGVRVAFWPVQWAGASASAGRQALQALSGRAIWLGVAGWAFGGAGIWAGPRAAFPARSHGLSTAKTLRAGRQASHYTISLSVLLLWALRAAFEFGLTQPTLGQHC